MLGESVIRPGHGMAVRDKVGHETGLHNSHLACRSQSHGAAEHATLPCPFCFYEFPASVDIHVRWAARSVYSGPHSIRRTKQAASHPEHRYRKRDSKYPNYTRTTHTYACN